MAVAENACKLAGLQCELVLLDSLTDRIPKLLDGTVDALVATLTVTDERRKQVLFVAPNYYASGACRPPVPPACCRARAARSCAPPAAAERRGPPRTLPCCAALRPTLHPAPPRSPLPPAAGVSLFALKDKAAGLASWEAVKGAKLCAPAGFYLNDELKSTYGAELVEAADSAAQLDKLIAGDCAAGALGPACCPAGAALACQAVHMHGLPPRSVQQPARACWLSTTLRARRRPRLPSLLAHASPRAACPCPQP